jgi:signal transduction histidine kinase
MLARLRTVAGMARRVDLVLVDVVVAGALLAILEAQTWSAIGGQHRVAAAAIELLMCAAVAVRRRWLWPAMNAVIFLAVVGVALYGSSAPGPKGAASALIPILLLYAGGAFLTGVRSWLLLAYGCALLVYGAATQPDALQNLVFNAPIFGGLPFAVGRWARERREREQASRERAERIDAERELRVRAAALGERARLAREIHDVVAHSVSVMVIQAAGARAVMDGEPDRASAALSSVERAGREALAEMRRLLGVLGDGERLRALAPQPGVEDLAELVRAACAAGLPASIRVEGEPVIVPAGLSLCAYRVVQEALTNSIKHAGPARAEVAVRWRPDVLELEIADDGPGPVRSPRGGHGLMGMRERTALHGGSVSTGPRPGGGFAVCARIPLATGSAG